MARTHAKILTTIWQDDDFASLPAASQRMYFVLISQPKLSTCGALDYLPSRLARSAPDLNVAAVEAAVVDLERARFVLVDRSTDELLIRTFVRNDGVCHRWQMVVAMWSAWEKVLSRALRLAIVHEAPSIAWETEKASPPAEAVAMRSEPKCDPDWQSDCESDSNPQQLQPTTADCRLQTAVAPSVRESKPMANRLPIETKAVAVASARRTDEAFEALCRVTATNPAELTTAARGAMNRALAEIRGVYRGDDLAAEILTRAGRYITQMGEARITPSALAKHWGSLTVESERLQSSQQRKNVTTVADESTLAIASKWAR